MNDNLSTIVQGRVFDGILFATHRDRALYIGKLVRNRPQWLNQNPDKWRRIEDIQREAASLAAAVESELNIVAPSSGSNRQMSSLNTQAGNSSAPYQPTSLPAPVNENVRSGSTQTELLRSTEAVTRETNESETYTTPLEETERKQGRAGRQRKKRKLSAKLSKARRKRMLAVLDYLREYPVLSDAANKAGIHRKTLENLRKRSETGDEGYDFEEDGLMWRFHELVESAIDEAHDKISEVAWNIGMSSIVYKYDESLLSRGFEGPDAYLRDENGIPVVKTVSAKSRGKMLRFLLERLRPEVYGKDPKIDVPHKTGVVLIGDTPKKRAKCPAASIRARKWKAASAMIRKAT